MTRVLRPRKARPSYVFEDEESESGQEDDRVKDRDSGDDFEPAINDGKNEAEADLDDDEPSDAEGSHFEEAVDELDPSSPPKKVGEGRNAKSNRQQYALPLVSTDRRQRLKPLYLHRMRVERLLSRPSPFAPSETIPTNNCLYDRSVFDRYLKASEYNIGPGPIWELMEDRSWWKESLRAPAGDVEYEALRRPRMHSSLTVDLNLKLLTEQESLAFFSDSGQMSTPSIKCSFGSAKENTSKEIRALDAILLRDLHHRGSACHVFNAGGPVWGMDWCPIFADDRKFRAYRQYLAVSSCSELNSSMVGSKSVVRSRSCIQIWSFGAETSREGENTAPAESEIDDAGNNLTSANGVIKCELVICLDCGPAQELKWCPLPSHDSWSTKTTGGVRKLGLLAGVFKDGSLSILVAPDPQDFPREGNGNLPYVSLNPLIRIELDESTFTTLEWANSEVIAAGCANGYVAVYNISSVLSGESRKELLPSHYLPIHQSAIRSLQWIRLPRTSADGQLDFLNDPTILASGGYDGCITLTDIREGRGNTITRTRGIVMSLAFSAQSQGIVATDQENVVKTFSISPIVLGRGHQIVEASAPVWSIATSDYHPHLAFGSADGSLVTTNLLKHPRRGTIVPPMFYKIFQLDYSRKHDEYRMLDHFLPQEVPERPSGKKYAKDQAVPSLGSWSPEVSVTRVAWNNGGGLVRAPLLASATASGLCRVDYLLGFLPKDEVPYGGIQAIRRELGELSTDGEAEE